MELDNLALESVMDAGARGARCRLKVNFQVAGAGDLNGVENGNPHNVDRFSRPRHYILRPAKWPGGLMFTA
jgi:hypothetical protein